MKAVGKFIKSDDRILLTTHATFRFAVDELAMEAFDDRLIAVDEFHHVTANPDNKLGQHLGHFMARDKAHIVAMTGSIFSRRRGGRPASPDDEAKFDTVTYTYYEQLNGYDYLKTLDIGYFFYSRRLCSTAIDNVLDPARENHPVHIPECQQRARAPRTSIKRGRSRSWTLLGDWQGADPKTGFQLM